jgi:hypothetical protein
LGSEKKSHPVILLQRKYYFRHAAFYLFPNTISHRLKQLGRLNQREGTSFTLFRTFALQFRQRIIYINPVRKENTGRHRRQFYFHCRERSKFDMQPHYLSLPAHTYSAGAKESRDCSVLNACSHAFLSEEYGRNFSSTASICPMQGLTPHPSSGGNS